MWCLLFSMGIGCYSLNVSSPASDDFIVAANGYRKNWEALREFHCRYVVEDCRGKSIDAVIQDKDIVRGQNQSGGMPWYATWIVKGTSERVWVANDKAWPVGLWPVPELSTHVNYTSDGVLALDVSLSIPVAILKKVKGKNTRLNVVGNPLQYASFTRGRDLAGLGSKHLRKELFAEFVGKETLFGHETLVFRTGKSASEIDQVFNVDPQRGFLPVKCQLLDPKTGKTIWLGLMTKVKMFPDGRAFPERSVAMWLNDKEDKAGYVFREFLVTEFDPYSPVDVSELSILVPKGYQIQSDVDRKWALMTTKKETVYQLTDLPKMAGNLEKSAEQWKALAQKHVRFEEGSTGKWVMVISIIALVFGALSCSNGWFRHQRRDAAR
jgi:hypothetical protein